MRELKLLLKVQLLRLFGINKLKYMGECPEKKKLRTNIVMYTVVGIIMMPIMFMYFLGFASILEPQGQVAMLPALAVTVASLIVVITSIFNAANNLFIFSDFDTTVSLPISLRVVALSRLLKIYGVNLFFTAFIMIPVLIAYSVYVHISAGFVLLYLLFVFIVPMLPVVVSSFISVLLTKLTSRIKKKSTANLVLSVLLTALLALFVLFSGSMGENFDSIVTVLAGTVERVYPMSLWLSNGLADGSAALLLAFAAINIVPFTLFTLLLGNMLKPMNSVLLSSSGSHEKLDRKSIVASSAFTALLTKDLRRYVASINCFMNVAIGYLILLVGAVVIAVSGGSVFENMSELPMMGDVIKQMLPYLASIIVGLTNPNAAVISLEGKSLWQLKSLPLPLKDIMKAKLSVGLVTSLPITVISMVLVAITLKYSFASTAILILVPLSQAVISSVFSLKLNFEHPKFDWTNEAETVKQGMPVLLTMLLGFVAPAIPMVLSFNLSGYEDVIAICYIAVTLIISFLIWRSLCSKKTEQKLATMN